MKVRGLLSTIRLIVILYINIYNCGYVSWCNYAVRCNSIIWHNYFKEGFLLDQLSKLLINNFILYWIIEGAQYFNFNWINRLLFVYYYNNIFLILYFNILHFVHYSLVLIFWKLSLILYYSLYILIILYFLI